MRFKSILGALFFISFASLLAFIIFIQTKSFGGLVTKVLSDISEKKTQTQVSIKSIEISLFPPGIELNRVRVSKTLDKGKKFKAELGKLGFYISLVELEEKKLTFGEIRISDSTIDYQYPEDPNEEEIKQLDQKLIDQIFDVSSHIPVRIDTLLIENSRVIANHELIEAKRLKIFKKAERFMTRFHLANLKPNKDKELMLDEIWGDVEIGRKDINIYRLKVQHDVHSFLVKGKIKDYPLLKKAKGNLNGEAFVYLANLKESIEIPKQIQLRSGLAHVKFNVNVQDLRPQGSGELHIQDLKSNLIYADSMAMGFELIDDHVRLINFDFNYKDQKMKLLSPAVVLNLKSRHFLQDSLEVQVENASLPNVLRYLGPSFKSLKGKLSGHISFEYENGDLYFTPQENFIAKNLGFVVGTVKKPFSIIMIKEARFNSSSFRVVDNEFQMDAVIHLKNSKLKVKGLANKNRIAFSAKDATIDLEDFGNISQLGVKGRGGLNIDVAGPLDDTIINIDGKTKGFEILGYKLGQADKKISIELKDSNVIIQHLDAAYGGTTLSGTGSVNWNNSDIALGINSSQANYLDLQEILSPIFSKLGFLPKDLDFNAKIDTHIFGKTSLDKIKVKADVKFSDLGAFKENLNSGELKVNFENQTVSLNDFHAVKADGFITGDFSYNLLTDKMKMSYSWENLALSSFNMSKLINLNLDGRLSGTFKGEGSTKNYVMQLTGKIDQTETPGYKFQDSQFDFYIDPSHIEGKANLLGDIIHADIDYSLNQTRSSRLALQLDIPDIKAFSSAFLGLHLESKNFSGKVKFDLVSQFSAGFKNIDLSGRLEKFQFKHENFNVNYQSHNPQFIIANDQVIKWSLDIQEPDLFFVTKGKGVFGRQVALIHEIHFNSKIIELMIDPVLSADGFIRNVIKVDGIGDKYNFSILSKTKNLNFTISAIPVPLNDLKYSIEYSNKRLLIHDFSTHLDNGQIKLNGEAYFGNSQPDMNIKFSLDRAEFPILGKSLLNLSGEGAILGNGIPYDVSGEIVINKAQIVNELNDFGSKSTALSQVRFLPKSQESPLEKLIRLNVNVKAENLIRISNSLMDIGLKGEVRVLGNPLRPRGEGHLYSPVNASRVFFKNNEYFITNADLNFSPKKEISNPDFDVQALTYISTFKVYPKAYGDLERFNFDLTSDPALPRNSILSLIAFGYTDEIQSTLKQEDQQSLTQVGVGSFVFDRFKISDILNKQFGLQVNVGTVLVQSQDSMLSGRTQEGQPGTLGRTRSAAKIELKKRLDEALTLSVSSTMGGSIGQRQNMILNYSLTKKVQVEGIYELRTNAEGEEDVIDNSIGADLKLRWTFK